MGSKITIGKPRPGKSYVLPKIQWHSMVEFCTVVHCAKCGHDEIEMAECLINGKRDFTGVCCSCRSCAPSRKSKKAALTAWNKHNEAIRDLEAALRRR